MAANKGKGSAVHARCEASSSVRGHQPTPPVVGLISGVF